MSLMVKSFWIGLICLCLGGLVILGLIGIPAKPVTVVKTIPHERLPQ